MKCPRWQPWQIELLVRNHAHSTNADLAVALGRSRPSVMDKAMKLGLVKTAQHRAAAPRATQFKPGGAPWNKGVHYTTGGRSGETRFKPGHRAQTWVPIGSLRINADGYLGRKTNDEAPSHRHWTSVHRLVWEAAHGPVPAGHAVVFLPGRRTTVEADITLDALELLTRAELMRRNSVHTRMPPELVALVQLRGALNRQINARSKT